MKKKIILSGGTGDDTKAPSPVTPAPTRADSISVDLEDSYDLYYTLTEQRVPSSQEFAELAEVTRMYLEDSMAEKFTNTLVDLDNFLTFMVRQMFQSGEPVKCTYRSIGLFDPNSVEIPSADVLMGYVNDAFSEPQIEVYLEKVQEDLPGSNVFSTTSYISTDGSMMISVKKKGKGTILTAAAGASFTLLVGGLMVLSSRNNRRKARFDTQSVIDKLNDDLSTIDIMDMEDISLDDGGVNKKVDVIDVTGY